MERIKRVVLEQHTKIMQERGINESSREDMKFDSLYGIDSLGLVELIIGIEEELNVELDECLASIRSCESVGELVNIIEKFVLCE